MDRIRTRNRARGMFMASEAIVRSSGEAPRVEGGAEAEDRQIGFVRTVLPLLPYAVYLVLTWKRPSQYVEILAIEAHDFLHLGLVYLTFKLCLDMGLGLTTAESVMRAVKQIRWRTG